MTTVHPDVRPEHPVVTKLRERRTADVQLRIADAITKFAGSMWFVYLHVVAFAVWMLFVESSPWPTLTLVVSLEAIFLSTFVMISQNRADEKRQVIVTRHHVLGAEIEKGKNLRPHRVGHEVGILAGHAMGQRVNAKAITMHRIVDTRAELP